MQPQANRRFPIYIVSKGRWDSRYTSKLLERMGVPYFIIVEEQEYENYCAAIDRQKVLILDKEYQRTYDTYDDLGETKSKGPGAARNFAWDHSIQNGYTYHWVMDDNIRAFYRTNHNMRNYIYDPIIFTIMEDFVLRYQNIAIAGPNYFKFAVDNSSRMKPFILNTRIYSCNFIRNDIPYRWRGRYNEDTDLSLRVLKDGWCTVQFNAILQDKITTQKVRGGNNADFYQKEGTLPKSQLLAKMHPDVCKVVWKFHRWHHEVNYKPFRNNKLIRRPDIEVPEGIDNYGLVFIKHEKELSV